MDVRHEPRRRVRLALAFAGFALIGIGGGASGVLLPAQIDYYHIDKAVIGLLFFTFTTGYVLAGAANGTLLRRLGPRGTLVLGTGAFALAGLGGGLRPSYPVLALVTVLFGLGSGIIDAGLNAYATTLRGHTALLNYLHAFYGVGALAGPVMAAGLLDRGLQWNAVYLVLAAGAVPLLVGFALRYPGTGTAAEDELVRPRAFRAALRHRGVVLAAVFLAVYVGVEVGIGNWGYSFLTEERGQGALLAGWVVSAYWFGFTAGRFVLNAAAERAGVGPVALIYGCLAGVAAGAALVLLPPAWAPAVGLAVLGFFLGPIFPLTIAVLPGLAPRWLVPTAVGVLVGTSVGGGALFPWVAGAMADRYGLDTLLPYTLGLTALLTLLWWAVNRPSRSPRPAGTASPAQELSPRPTPPRGG